MLRTWRARSKQTMAVTKKAAARRLICLIFSLVVNFDSLRSGFWKKKNRTVMTMAPTGRFI